MNLYEPDNLALDKAVDALCCGRWADIILTIWRYFLLRLLDAYLLLNL